MKIILKVLISVAVLITTATAQTSSRIVCDENCKTESGSNVVKGDGFAVVSPVGRGTVQTMPGGGFETVAIELPRNWDKLMQERDYRPISEFYIK